jgi:hypothetical protein
MFAMSRIGRIAAIVSLFVVMLAGAGAPAGAAKAGGADNGEYTAPDFAVTLSYDAELWTVDNDVSVQENNGRDELRLINGDTDAVLYLETYDGYNGKAADCIDSAVSEVTGDAKTTPIEDRRGNKIAGSKKGVTWAAYSYKDTDGAKLATFVECRALPKAAGVFVASLLTTQDDFNSDYLDVQDILDTVDLGGSASAGKTNSGKTGPGGSDSNTSPTATAGGTNSTQGSGTQVGDYLTIAVPDDWTVKPFASDSFSEGGAQIFNLTALTSISLFTVSPEIATMGIEKMLDTYAGISSKSLGEDVVPATFQDGTDAKEIKGNAGYAYYLFTEAGISNVLYVNIQVMDDGRAIVFAATGPQQLFDQVYKDSLQPMLDSLTYLG